ncbi:BRO family protein [Eubacterium sp.]|uniref:BRO-N domain-containing protein n=1 Tax=Eubacterium sp. TaxID=142586 RepID=UPI0026E0BD93|nr:BRO family protein [Eubacterium sp.]MDO5434656.1 BRO family protein [Eubacterium sp.]
MKGLRIFENETFGQVRCLEIEGRPYFVASDVALALGYKDTTNAVKQHCKGVVKRHILTNGGKQQMNLIPEGDMYRLITHSKLPSAERFESWVFDEILPALRKTGTYTTQEAQPTDEVKLLNAKSRAMNAEARLKTADCKRAELLYKLSQVDTLSKTYEPVLIAKAADIVNGGELIPLPKVTRKTYTATEVAEVFDVTANKIGRIATKHNLKNEQYGEWYRDVAKGGKKEVDTFKYYDCTIPVFKRILEKEAKEAQA